MTLTKNSFRRICLQKIKKASQHNKFYKDFLINNVLLKELEHFKTGKRLKILFFYPLPYEADILKVLKKMRKKHDIFVPFMQGESFKMVPFRLPLKKKKFDIFEAGNTIKKNNKIDIAIVPAVGVDGNLQRIGFGKGMYDRFFAKLKEKPYTIFVQPVFCHTESLICDAYDVACDVLITPTRTLRKRSS
ncbi:5-formyltetrahydrofolate cyclo-ligase [Sulfurimonas sediminis]|uniref:5-formyltetrahydrofolate cyclo-ligase n=1 Tax=Sulfurimonas sediminis TaxID=2590020 RepID=A0A7M1B240_9BACT|nr:5-formyltetrahydrofolate cyclo-ligase [Sulfurimonas sediminis]QOP43837.1 5-formyltetrahydrofolate cyclo-ligase [Sulfurimonas sediminis]